MTSPVITMPADTPVAAAAALLAAHGFTAAPVVDKQGRVVGIASETDLVRGRIQPEGWQAAPRLGPGATVGDVMTRAPVLMPPEADLSDLVSLMLEAQVRSIPIVSDGELVGIVTRRDILRVIARGERTSAEVAQRRGSQRPVPR
jgi:CBS domain-containing protein